MNISFETISPSQGKSAVAALSPPVPAATADVLGQILTAKSERPELGGVSVRPLASTGKYAPVALIQFPPQSILHPCEVAKPLQNVGFVGLALSIVTGLGLAFGLFVLLFVPVH